MAAKRTRRKTGKKNTRRHHWPWRKWLLWTLVTGLGFAFVVCVFYFVWASRFDLNGVKNIRERSTVYDQDGKVYSRLAGENRITVGVGEVSKNFVDALLAREDSRFYKHFGVDPFGIARAIVRNLGGSRQGASTLTQQLARNSFEGIGTKRSIHRKMLEAFVAVRIEQKFSKREILEHYMNRIYLGAGTYGIETASMAYFGKHAKDLTLGEAAMIAGIIRAPTTFSPVKNLKGALRERDTVLERMVKQDMITPEDAAEAKSVTPKILKRRTSNVQENYAMDAVARELDVLLTDDQLAQGGFKIYTTLDPDLQKAAQTAVDNQLRKLEARPGWPHPRKTDFTKEARDEEIAPPYLQGAIVVVDNRDGGIRALVGGRDYTESKYNRAMPDEPQRAVGSTFKPFVYAAAFDRGLLPGTRISDERITSGEVKAAPGWSPDNSDSKYEGYKPAEDGLIHSRNTMTVRVGEKASLDEVVKLAASAGLENVPKRPAIYLGAFEARLDQLTAAYTVFPNNGIKRRSYLIERIDDAEGDIIYRAPRRTERTLDAGSCWLVTQSLVHTMERGTGAAVKTLGFTKPCAGKTGTTNDYHDAWFVGYTTTLTAGVWVGFDQPKTIMPKGYGATISLPIWAETMSSASAQRYPAKEFQPLMALRRCDVCAASGGLATDNCGASAYRAELPPSIIPRFPCKIHGGTATSPVRDESQATSPTPAKSEKGFFRSFKDFFNRTP